MRLEKLRVLFQIIFLTILGPIAIFGWWFGSGVSGGFLGCPYPLPFIMCHACPVFCNFGQIRLWLFYGILGTSLLAGRTFCGLFCPFGVAQDLLFKIPLKKIPIKPTVNKSLRYLKFAIAILLIALLIEALGLWGGEGLWSFMVGHTEGMRLVRLTVAIVFLLLALFLSRAWCNYLCPFGAWLSVFNRNSLLKIKRDPQKCLDCRDCLKYCPAGLNPRGGHEVWDSLDCNRCLQCYTRCQGKAIDLKSRLGKQERTYGD